jgi:hypothetical protein
MPALMPLVLMLAPTLAQYLFGAKAEHTAAQVAAVATTITGTADPGEQVATLSDPDKAAALTIALHKLAAAMQTEQHDSDLAAMQAQFADIANARGQTLALVQDHSAIAWGAPIVSIVVMATFGLMCAMVLSHQLPPGSENLASILLGALSSMAAAVAAYWVGSSAGSRAKDSVIATANQQLANSVPISAAPPLH